MWIVFCAPHDSSAIRAWVGLKRRGLGPLELVTSDCLAFARLWEHRVGAEGAHFKIGLQDGRVLCSSRIRGALNRLSIPSMDLVAHAAPSDREYATSELQAFYLSWLNAVPGVVINRPHPLGFSGAWRHASEWAIRASRAGLRTAAYRQSGRDPVERGYFPLTPEGAIPQAAIVLGGEVFGGDFPDAVKSACVRMAQAENLELLGVDLYPDENGAWTFGNATPAPFLELGGEPLLDKMAEIFRQGDGK